MVWTTSAVLTLKTASLRAVLERQQEVATTASDGDVGDPTLELALQRSHLVPSNVGRQPRSRDVAGRRLDLLAGAAGNAVHVQREAQLEHTVIAWGPRAPGRWCGPAHIGAGSRHSGGRRGELDPLSER